MVEKKVVDKILIEFMNQTPIIRYIMVMDREGFPISYIARVKQETYNPKILGAVFQSFFTPAFHFAGSYNISTPIVGVFMLSDKILMQINLGYGLITFILEKSKWPIEPENFERLFRDLYKLLPQLQSNKKSLLKDVFPEGIIQEGGSFMLDEKQIPIITECLGQCGKGSFGSLGWTNINGDPKTLITTLGTNVSNAALNTLILTPDGTRLFGSNPNMEKAAKISISAQESNTADLKIIKFGNLLMKFYCFLKGETVLCAPIGKFDNKEVQLSMQIPKWQVGINQAFSILYTAAAVSHQSIGSPESTQFIELMNYLMSSPQDLRQQIDHYLGAKNNKTARDLMERSAYLLQKDGDLSVAGDYIKWIAYTYFQEGDYPKALIYYERSSKLYEKANDLKNVAANHVDIASVFETLKQKTHALEQYQKAKFFYSQIGATTEAQELEIKINEIKTDYKKKLKDYIQSMNGETLMFDYISEKFSIKTSVIPLFLQELIDENAIPGQVDTLKLRYTKSQMKASQPTAKSAQDSFTNARAASSPIKMSMGGIGIPTPNVKGMDYSNAYAEANNLKAENIQLNSDLSSIEQRFQMKGVNFMEMLKYQAKLEKKNFNELRVRIYSEMPQFNDAEGIPTLCSVCMNPVDLNEPVGICPQGHGYHAKCLSKWIKTQDRCPVCNERLLPFVLRDFREAIGSTAGWSGADSQETQELRQQVTLLKQSLGKDSDMFDKFVAEREDKNRAVADLKKKEQLIAELRSQLQASKR